MLLASEDIKQKQNERTNELGSYHQLTNELDCWISPDITLCGWLGLELQLTN